MKSKLWKPTIPLETAERNFYLDNIAFNHQRQVPGKSRVKMDQHNTPKRIEKDDGETRLTHCYGYAIQGDWLNFDAVLKADLSWNSLIYSIPQELLKFLLSSTHNVLPTSDNLRRWGKTVVDLKCCLCGFSNPTLKHILNGCSMALKQGRYTWRHDSILQHLVEDLKSFVGCANSGIENTFIKFVREGKQPSKRRVPHKSGLLFTANDWVLVYDNPHNPLVIPHHIVQTPLRPDIIIYSNATKQVFILELTVPAEDNIIQRHTDKESKYAKLLDDININQWTGHVVGIEIGSRGYVAKSFGFALQKLGLKQDAITKLRKAISLIYIRCSYLIYLSRKNEIWRPWEAQHPTSKARSSSRPNFETEAFCGFETTQIQEAFNKNQRSLDVLSRKIENPNTFQGFNTQEIRTYKKIKKDRTEVLKGAGHSKTSIPIVYEQVFPKTRKLVTFGSKTSTSLVNNQGSKITPGLLDFSRKTHFSSADDHASLIIIIIT